MSNTPQERANHIIAALNEDPDAARRYHTIRYLQEGPLRDAAATALRQLRDERGTTEAAAKAAGITRQAVNELLTKAGAPGAREDRARTDTSPACGYGAWLAIGERIAALAGKTRTASARREDPEYMWARRMRELMTGTVKFAPAQRDLHRWLKWVPDREEWRDRLDVALSSVTPEWLKEAEYMSPAGRDGADVVLAYHQQRRRLLGS